MARNAVRFFHLLFFLIALILPSPWVRNFQGAEASTIDLIHHDDKPSVLFADLEAGRVCRPSLPSESALLQQPLMPQPPHPLPFKDSIFDLVLVLQRHGLRRSVFAAANTPFYRNARPGQLVPQGAYQLRVSGIEARYYLEMALGCSKSKLSAEGGDQTDEQIYSKTLGLDITQDCAQEGLKLCTSSRLAAAVGRHLPTDSVYVRANGVPRTQWSALKFLEGFYGLPSGCGARTEQVLTSSRVISSGVVCPERSVCDSNASAVEAKKTLKEVCITRKLPCINTPRLEEDGISCGAGGSRIAFDQAWASYKHLPPGRKFVHADSAVRNAQKIAAKILKFSDTDVLPVGEMVYAEQMSGEPKPVQAIAQWFDKYEKDGGDLTLEGVEEAGIPSYEELLRLLLKGFHDSSIAMYGDDQFSRYTVSPLFLLLNSMFRTRAFGRTEDWENLREIMQVLGGFEGFVNSGNSFDDFQAATKKLKLLLISLQDYLLTASQRTLGFGNEEILPFAIKIMFELTHVPENSLRGTSEQPSSTPLEEVSTAEATADSDATVLPNTSNWPSNKYFVRVMMGTPGKDIRPMQLPWCENKTACPLNKWLDYTYQTIEGHTLIDRVSIYREKYDAGKSGE